MQNKGITLYFMGTYTNYEMFDSKKFRVKLENELVKFDIKNVEFLTFDNILFSVLKEYAPLKQKHLRGYHQSYMKNYYEQIATEE